MDKIKWPTFYGQHFQIDKIPMNYVLGCLSFDSSGNGLVLRGNMSLHDPIITKTMEPCH